jgi:hypothetical protein
MKKPPAVKPLKEYLYQDEELIVRLSSFRRQGLKRLNGKVGEAIFSRPSY